VRQLGLVQFQAERTRFALRFTCEHCTYFQVELERCSHGYPNAEHRDARYLYRDGAQTELVFCKEFELR